MSSKSTATSISTPSSATEGFFQQYPTIEPQYTSQAGTSSNITSSDDAVLDSILRLYLPQPIPAAVDQSLHDFAQTCLDPETLRLTVDCETDLPKLQLLTTFGERNDVDPLRTSEGWRGLKDIQTRSGIIAHGYRAASVNDSANAGEDIDDVRYNRRVHQFALGHLWGASCASVSCPAAMSDGAAVLLRRQLDRMEQNAQSGKSDISGAVTGQDENALQRVIQEAYARLVSFDTAVAWTSGQWMTERPGGSNVADTETLARLMSQDEKDTDAQIHGGLDVDAIQMPLGPYVVNGFKWFSSATDADMVVLLAKTPKGLSAFYAPMRRAKTLPTGKVLSVMNGVRISRLKNKLGTKGLPTAELEIKGMRAWLLGEEGKGVKEISAILNLTRLWTGCGSMGYWSRGLAVSRAYAKVRRIKGGLLCESKSHLRWMANETVKYRACAHLAFLGVALLGLSEAGWDTVVKGTAAEKWLPKTEKESEVLLRLLTPVIKAQCSTWAVWGLRECMESLGGVGYCETNEGDGVMNLARLCRDAMVNPMWEGTTTILSEDFARVLKGRDGSQALAAMNEMVSRMLNDANPALQREATLVHMQWTALVSDWLSTTALDRLMYDGREVLQKVHDLLGACLLLCDAISSGSDLEKIIASRWISLRFPDVQSNDQDRLQETMNDQRIFLGTHLERNRVSLQPKL